MTKKEAIEGFVGKAGEHLNDLSRPWVRGGKICATNSRVLVAVPVELFEGHPYAAWGEDRGNEPDFEKVIPAPPLEFKVFDTATIDAALASTEPLQKVVPATEKCRKCGGTGEYEHWECDCVHDCPECDGEGKIHNEDAGETVPMITPTPMLGRYFNWHYLKPIKGAMSAFGGQWEVALGKTEADWWHRPPAVFRNDGGVVIAVMECRV